MNEMRMDPDALTASLAAEIRKEHAAAEQAARSAIQHAIRCGQLLIQAKSNIEHGAWLPWVRENCPFSDRTASGYMRLAERLPELSDEDRQRVADLPLRQAIALLSDPKTPRADDPERPLLSPIAATTDPEPEDIPLSEIERVAAARRHSVTQVALASGNEVTLSSRDPVVTAQRCIQQLQAHTEVLIEVQDALRDDQRAELAKIRTAITRCMRSARRT